jgi:hypothetical protein
LRPSKSIWTDAKNARNPLTTGVSTLGRIKTPSGDEASSGSRNSGNRAARFRSDIGDAYEELRERGEDDGSIPAFLRRYEICAQCGRPGGAECAHDGVVVCLHSACQRSWIDAYEESHAGAFTAIAE